MVPPSDVPSWHSHELCWTGRFKEVWDSQQKFGVALTLKGQYVICK